MVECGPIIVHRMPFEVSKTDALEVAQEASDKLNKELIGLRGMTWSKGVLLTAGLNESLRDYAGSTPYAIKTIEDWLAREKSAATEAKDK